MDTVTFLSRCTMHYVYITATIYITKNGVKLHEINSMHMRISLHEMYSN